MIKLERDKEYRTAGGQRVKIITDQSWGGRIGDIYDAQTGKFETAELYREDGSLVHPSFANVPYVIVAEWRDPISVLNIPSGYSIPQSLVMPTTQDFAAQLAQLQRDLAERQHKMAIPGVWKTERKCTCDSRELFNFGCKCGQFARERA